MGIFLTKTVKNTNKIILIRNKNCWGGDTCHCPDDTCQCLEDQNLIFLYSNRSNEIDR